MDRKVQTIICGFRKEDEELGFEYIADAISLATLQQLLDHPQNDPEICYSYLLNEEQSQSVEDLIGFKLDTEAYDLFIERNVFNAISPQKSLEG